MFCLPKSIYLRKYLFLVLLVICVSAVLLLLHVCSLSNEISFKVKEEIKPTSKYAARAPLNFSEEMLVEDFDKCLKLNFTAYDYVQFGLKEFDSQEKKDEKSNSMFETLWKFSHISNHFKAETVLIDPFILFCMLSAPLKRLLLKRKLRLESSKNVPYLLTLGIFKKDVAKLGNKGTMEVFKKNGFEMEFIHRPRLEWMDYSDNLFTSHIFLKHKKCVLHVVVFHQRSNYLWHASILNPPYQLMSLNESYFTSEDSAYENFAAVSLDFKSEILKSIRIPSRPAEFLFQMAHSRFVECNMTIVDEYKKINTSELPNKHYSFSISEFNDILGESLRELKYQLDPLFLRFFIWSGTMLGWYRQCDVIPYTGDIDFGAWSSDVDDLDKLMQIFQKNKLLVIKQKMGLVDEGLEFNLNCLGIRVDIFFLQEESNGTWYAGHRPSRGYYFKYHHPNFSLCSADLLGHKVLVPCETESVITMEYGPDWMLPVSSWNYETSIYNRGPNIYWNKTLLDKIYSDF